MKKFEHLFSQDPIGAFEKIEEDYKRYFDVSYKISNEEINKERMDALRTDNNLSKEPYIELLPSMHLPRGCKLWMTLSVDLQNSLAEKNMLESTSRILSRKV